MANKSSFEHFCELTSFSSHTLLLFATGYKSELLFFDEYCIVVAKQMLECGVFGHSGDEQLSFALTNRQQWAAKGGNLVASMVARYHGKEIEKVRAKRVHRRMSLSAKQA